MSLNRYRLADAHLVKVVSKLLSALKADDISSTISLAFFADRSDRTGDTLVRATEQEV